MEEASGTHLHVRSPNTTSHFCSSPLHCFVAICADASRQVPHTRSALQSQLDELLVSSVPHCQAFGRDAAPYETESGVGSTSGNIGVGFPSNLYISKVTPKYLMLYSLGI